MSNTDELLIKCSELVLIMSEMEKEVPKLKKYFSECKKLHKELTKQIAENEDILDQRFSDCQQMLDKQTKKISAAIKKYEKTYESIVRNEDVLKTIQKNAENQILLQTQITQLNNRLTKLEQFFDGSCSLKDILSKAGNNFPIKVHKEGEKAWSRDYYFEVERIEGGYAYGNTYIGNRLSKRSHRRSLDEKPFTIYIPPLIPSNLPETYDEELPFN